MLFNEEQLKSMSGKCLKFPNWHVSSFYREIKLKRMDVNWRESDKGKSLITSSFEIFSQHHNIMMWLFSDLLPRQNTRQLFIFSHVLQHGEREVRWFRTEILTWDYCCKWNLNTEIFMKLEKIKIKTKGIGAWDRVLLKLITYCRLHYVNL